MDQAKDKTPRPDQAATDGPLCIVRSNNATESTSVTFGGPSIAPTTTDIISNALTGIVRNNNATNK